MHYRSQTIETATDLLLVLRLFLVVDLGLLSRRLRWEVTRRVSDGFEGMIRRNERDRGTYKVLLLVVFIGFGFRKLSNDTVASSRLSSSRRSILQADTASVEYS